MSASSASNKDALSVIEGVVGGTAKFFVAAVSTYTVMATPTWLPIYVIIGAVLNGFVGKLVKRVVRQPRPAGSRKKGNGMPSSHAQTLFYFTTVLALLSRNAAAAVSPFVWLSALVYSVVATSYRVTSQLHTFPQTVVGAALGIGAGCVAMRYERVFVEAQQSPPSMAARVAFVCLCGSVLFFKDAKVFWNATSA
jgi:dolichyldiphosphatase